MEQNAKKVFQEFFDADPSAGDYIHKMRALAHIVADLEWYKSELHLDGTVQVSPMTPQPPGRSLADASPLKVCVKGSINHSFEFPNFQSFIVFPFIRLPCLADAAVIDAIH